MPLTNSYSPQMARVLESFAIAGKAHNKLARTRLRALRDSTQLSPVQSTRDCFFKTVKCHQLKMALLTRHAASPLTALCDAVVGNHRQRYMPRTQEAGSVFVRADWGRIKKHPCDVGLLAVPMTVAAAGSYAIGIGAGFVGGVAGAALGCVGGVLLGLLTTNMLSKGIDGTRLGAVLGGIGGFLGGVGATLFLLYLVSETTGLLTAGLKAAITALGMGLGTISGLVSAMIEVARFKPLTVEQQLAAARNPETFEWNPLSDVPKDRLFFHHDYGFDIRELAIILGPKSESHWNNPYTQVPFTREDIQRFKTAAELDPEARETLRCNAPQTPHDAITPIFAQFLQQIENI